MPVRAVPRALLGVAIAISVALGALSATPESPAGPPPLTDEISEIRSHDQDVVAAPDRRPGRGAGRDADVPTAPPVWGLVVGLVVLVLAGRARTAHHDRGQDPLAQHRSLSLRSPPQRVVACRPVD